MSVETEIKAAVKNNNIILGSKKVITVLKMGNAKSIVVSSDCKEYTLKDIEHNAKISSVKLKNFNGKGIELGALCGKPFSVSVIAIKG